MEEGLRPGLFPDLLDWLDAPWAAPLLPFTAARTFRVEDYVEDGRYTVARCAEAAASRPSPAAAAA